MSHHHLETASIFLQYLKYIIIFLFLFHFIWKGWIVNFIDFGEDERLGSPGWKLPYSHVILGFIFSNTDHFLQVNFG